MNAEERERASARGEVRAETGASEAMQNVVIHRSVHSTAGLETATEEDGFRAAPT
jgi:hypothetical protein